MCIKQMLKRIFNNLFVSTGIVPIRFVILIENVLCVYRNLDYYKKKCRVGIILRILIELTLTIACIVSYSIYVLPISSTTATEGIYIYMNAISSIIVILLACYTSKKFKKLVLLIEENNLYFANDQKYQSNIKRRNTLIKNGLIVSNVIIILVEFGEIFYRNTVASPNIINILFTFNMKLCNCRGINEYLVLYSILYVMSEQVECIKRAVSKEQISDATEQRYDISDEDFNETQLEVTDFEELSTIFANIKESSKLFNKIFGLQLVIMLGLATTYCIMFMYTMAFFSVKGLHGATCLFGSVLKLLMFFLLLLLLSLGGQKKQNNVQDLRRQLGKLLIKSVTNDAHYKATKDFLRLVSTRSTRTETLGSINVDMSLIPSFIMFTTSYTVIALQFNNVV